nr:hypothetical protein [Tanacetum cinerariifolium]
MLVKFDSRFGKKTSKNFFKSLRNFTKLYKGSFNSVVMLGEWLEFSYDGGGGGGIVFDKFRDNEEEVGEEKLVFKSVKPATIIIKMVFVMKSLESETKLIGEDDETFDPTYGNYIELKDLDTPLKPKTNQNDNFEPTFVKTDSYEMKLSCIIMYKYVNTDLLPSLPVNLMSKSFYYSIIKDKDERRSHAGTLVDIPVFVRRFSIFTSFTIIDDDDITKDVVLNMKSCKKYASCQMFMKKFAHEEGCARIKINEEREKSLNNTKESENKANDASDSDMDLSDDNPHEDDDAVGYGVFMHNKSTATPNSTYLSLTVTSSSLDFIQTLLDETPVNELIDFISHAVYTDAQTTSVVHNPEGNPKLISYISGAFEVPLEALEKVVQAKVLTEIKKLLPSHIPSAVANYKLYDTLFESVYLDHDPLNAQYAELSFHKRSRDNQDSPNNREGENKRKRRKDKLKSANAKRRWFDLLLKSDIDQNENHTLGPSTVAIAKKIKAIIQKDELTIAYLEGAGLERLKQQYQNDVELEYHVDQLKAAVLTRAKWNTDEGVSLKKLGSANAKRRTT